MIPTLTITDPKVAELLSIAVMNLAADVLKQLPQGIERLRKLVDCCTTLEMIANEQKRMAMEANANVDPDTDVLCFVFHTDEEKN